MNSLRNIAVVIAVLAVALLASLAIANRNSDRDQATRESVVALCEKTNVGRQTINAMVNTVNVQNAALQDALEIAQRERNQSTQAQVDYAKIQAGLAQIRPLDTLVLPDCKNDVLGGDN